MSCSNFKFIIVLMMTSVIATKSFSQENYFKISAQYRARTEVRNGYRTLVTDSSKTAVFTGQRVRLIFDYKKDNIQFYSSVQDARTWGDEEQKKDLGGLQVNELWMEVNLNKKFSLKMGRQELAYLPNVGSTFKNYFGVWDLHGLVWEWTFDFNSALTTGESRGNSGLDNTFFCGGGSFASKDINNYASFMRFASRSSVKAKYGVPNLGFRCVKNKIGS